MSPNGDSGGTGVSRRLVLKGLGATLGLAAFGAAALPLREAAKLCSRVGAGSFGDSVGSMILNGPGWNSDSGCDSRRQARRTQATHRVTGSS